MEINSPEKVKRIQNKKAEKEKPFQRKNNFLKLKDIYGENIHNTGEKVRNVTLPLVVMEKTLFTLNSRHIKIIV